MKWFLNRKELCREFLFRMHDRRYRVAVSLFAGILAVSCMAGSVKMPVNRPVAWWGALYPEFCFAEDPQKEENDQNETEEEEECRPKISFWLAKAFNW